jgi:hypothetical protein
MYTQRGHAILYALDMLCVIIAVGMFGLTVYLLPYFLGFSGYDVPESVVAFRDYLQTHADLNGVLLIIAVLLPLLIAAICLLLISRLITIYLETHEPEPGVPHVDQDEYEEHVAKPSVNRAMLIKQVTIIVLMMLAVIGGLIGFEYYLIQSIG